MKLGPSPKMAWNWFSPGDREAAVAALLEADELLVAEVPAARPLIEVAADGALVADLRRADFDRRRGDRRIQPRDLRVLGEVDHLHRRADLQAAVDAASIVASSAFLTLTMRSGCGDVVLHPRQQVLTAADAAAPARAPCRERGDRVLLVRRIDVGKGLH